MAPLTPEALQSRRAALSAARRRRLASAAAVLVLCGALGVASVNAFGRHRRNPASRAGAIAPGVSPTSRARRPVHGGLRRRELAAVERTARRMPYVSVAGRRRRDIALTFDDGPGPYTPAVLQVLRRMRAPATFFQVGLMVNNFAQNERALLAQRGVVLGDHTEAHATLPRLSPAEQYSQINDAAGSQALHRAPWPHLFRPPYGAFDRTTLRVARGLHMLTVLWTVDSQDYRQPGVDAIVARVLDGARPGAIILLHDAGGTRAQTIQALPIIIRRLRARHYRLVTVPRLLYDNPPGLHQPAPPTGAG